MEQGFDAVATGHYARVVQATFDTSVIPEPVLNRHRESSSTGSPIPPSLKASAGHGKSGMTNKNGTWQLATARDEWKDQTYFLWRVPRERFARIRFPIGHLTKPQVRAAAIQRKLPNATKPDSQGICFLGKVDLRAWLTRELATVPGPVVTLDGKQIGEHAGAALFTIGQRHGFGNPGGTAAQYVVDRNVKTNTVTVADRSALAVNEFTIQATNWLTDEDPTALSEVEVRIRHQGERIPATLQVIASPPSQSFGRIKCA